MEYTSNLWLKWCRLCAKEDFENSVSITMNGLQQPVTMGEDVKLTLKEALEKYFWMKWSCEDCLPKFVCLECYTLISSVISFNERVERVQRMYKYLMETPLPDEYDLRSIRLKFMISDVRNGIATESDIPIETCQSENESDQSRFRIKQEYYNNDIKTSEYKDINNIEPEEGFFDEASETTHKQEDDKDPFDGNDKLKSDTSSCGEEAELSSPISQMRTRSRPTIASKTSKHEKRRKKIKEMKFKNMKSLVEDFVLDVTCTECGQKTSQLSTFCQHMRESHGYDDIEKHWKCPLCERKLKSFYNFKRHMRIHMPLECSKIIKCPECDNRYTSSAQLDAHRTYKHRNDKPFICEECGICVRTNSNLRQHMLIHTDNAPFECEICKKKFKNNSRLKIHMDIHSPNKHVCAICGMQLNSRATLNRHFLVHSEEMQHKCDYCGRAFKRAKALKNHLILHTGLKPYSCDFCDRTFANGSNCRSHMKKLHPYELASLEASGNKTHTKNIPKLETLKAVTKAADNLTPVVTKFSGCFAFGKKPKLSIDTTKSSKPTQVTEKDFSIQDTEKSTSLDPQNTPLEVSSTKANVTTNNITENSKVLRTTDPIFDSIYQQLLKQKQNNLPTKRPVINSDHSPANQTTYLSSQHSSFSGQNQQADSNTLKESQESINDILHSSSGYRISMVPLIGDNSHTSSSQPCSIRQTKSLSPSNFL